ncbi:MAG TPA: aminoacyl-tRNA hydrolase [Nitrospiraceae bacterium]|nr:aminoacyl-tRNA hydrolase [Nitrospiraceae bacterium]
MWLVAGLGNPGDEYADTRHNIGFMVIDALSARCSISIRQKTVNFIYGRGFVGEQKAILMKPLTFMNRSGNALWEAIRLYEEIDNILVVHDDLDLETGIIRIKKSGSSGGHNGVQSIIDRLGSQDFVRVKIGIGRPNRGPAEKYVLRRFNQQQKPVIEEAVERAADAVQEILATGVASAQNRFHVTKP